MPLAHRVTLTPAARWLGVTTDTLKRWEKAGKIARAHRDSRNARWWDAAELAVIRKWIETRAKLQKGCAP